MKRKIGHSWTKRMRKVNGKRRLVKVRKIGKKEQVRILNVRNFTDASARRMHHNREKRFYNSTDAGPRQHRIRRH